MSWQSVDFICKRQRHSTCIMPKAAYHSCISALQHKTASIQSRPQPNVHTYRLWPAAMRSSTLLFNGLHFYNPLLLHGLHMDYYSFTDHRGIEVWVGQVGWHIADSLRTTMDHAHVRESLPAKDRHPNHWATLPVAANCSQLFVTHDN